MSLGGVRTAAEAGLVGCTACGRVHPRGTTLCDRCGSRVAPPDPASLQAVWAWLIAGLVAYVPANIYPMLTTTLFGRTTENTIIGGAFELAAHGNWGVAAIVFVASVMIPLGKFGALAWLAHVARYRVIGSVHRRTLAYEVVEFIGRWSMVDVFVVAILAALVQMGLLATIKPGIAALSFAISVACTMISAHCFDPRLLWRAAPDPDA